MSALLLSKLMRTKLIRLNLRKRLLKLMKLNKLRLSNKIYALLLSMLTKILNNCSKTLMNFSQHLNPNKMLKK